MPTLRWLARLVSRLRSRSADRIEFAPEGWATRLPGGARSEDYWTHFLAQERTAYERVTARLRDGAAIATLNEDERIKYETFGTVIEMAAARQRTLSVLDVGGNLGEYYWLGKALAPGVDLDFHCRELPRVADAGRRINPSVTFHTGDDCLARTYDLVMFSSSVQCLPDWRQALTRAARAAGRYLFLSDVSAVGSVPGFVYTHYSDGVTTLLGAVNRTELIETLEAAGLRVVREFDMGAHPGVANAPEQPKCVGWLLRPRENTV